MLFAHLKRILRLDRLRLRGLKGAHDEFLLAATAQNLRRMAAWLMPKAPFVSPEVPLNLALRSSGPLCGAAQTRQSEFTYMNHITFVMFILTLCDSNYTICP